MGDSDRDSSRSMGAVLADIVSDVQQIVRAEVRLAKAELREEMGKARRGAVMMLAAGVMAVLGLGVALLAAVYALATIWPPWAAALAVAVGAVALGGALAVMGREHMKSVTLPPDRTVSSVRENIQWAKTRIR